VTQNVAESRTLRYCLWHLPARLVKHARRRILKISATRPWKEAFLTCWARRAVMEATRWTVEIDVSNIAAPAYILGAERDMVVPHEYVESLAKGMGAEYELLSDQGHGVPLNPIWENVATRISGWLDKTVK
jgi:pimeloyl-ACP methyl ester carboxylesterase